MLKPPLTMYTSYPGFDFVARPVMGGTFALLIANAQGTTPSKAHKGSHGMTAKEFWA